MRLHFEIELNASRDRVWGAFDNPANLPVWQPTFVSFEPLSGTPGEPGATSKLVYNENGRTVEMIETVETRREPAEFSGRYDTSHGTNSIQNRFDVKSPDQTLWTVDVTFEFKGFVMRVMGLFIGGMIRKRLLTDLTRFKDKLEAGELEIRQVR
ncbi:MAG: SRPBCC family protein [Planctomycetota bacterium]|nr:SRPBCC family protein [Planctomycetota bacterium]